MMITLFNIRIFKLSSKDRKGTVVADDSKAHIAAQTARTGAVMRECDCTVAQPTDDSYGIVRVCTCPRRSKGPATVRRSAVTTTSLQYSYPVRTSDLMQVLLVLVLVPPRRQHGIQRLQYVTTVLQYEYLKHELYVTVELGLYVTRRKHVATVPPCTVALQFKKT